MVSCKAFLPTAVFVCKDVMADRKAHLRPGGLCWFHWLGAATLC